MHTNVRHLSITAALAGTMALSACGGTETGMTGMTGMDGKSGAGSSATLKASVDPADVMFAQMMIPHHEQAVEMADLALSRAMSADVKALARKIKTAQDPEITAMNGWLSQWGAPTGSAGMSGMDHGGMMSEADMTKLRQASGEQFDRIWLTMMIAHHQGALTMAKNVLDTTRNPQVRTLAQNVVDGQTKEIGTMNALLKRT